MPNPLRLYTYIWAFGGEPMTPREDPTEFKWSKDARTIEAMEWVVDQYRQHGVRAGAHTAEGDSGSGSFPKNRVALSGYLGRCTGYQHIVDAVQAAAGGADGR